MLKLSAKEERSFIISALLSNYSLKSILQILITHFTRSGNKLRETERIPIIINFLYRNFVLLLSSIDSNESRFSSIFSEFKISIFLDFLYIINDIFKKIIIKNLENNYMDMDSLISDITDLAAILDSINWKQIVLGSYPDKISFTLLENFRNDF